MGSFANIQPEIWRYVCDIYWVNQPFSAAPSLSFAFIVFEIRSRGDYMRTRHIDLLHGRILPSLIWHGSEEWGAMHSQPWEQRGCSPGCQVVW